MIGGNDDITTYVDPAIVRKAANRVRMWDLMDYKRPEIGPGGKPHLSEKLQSAYDCKEQQKRLLYLSFYSERIGEGRIIHAKSYTGKKWIPVPPGSLAETMWKFACGKK